MTIANGILDENMVEVVYALPNYQHIFTVELSSFAPKKLQEITLLDVIKQSGILEYYPEIDLSRNPVGVYSEIKNLTDHINLHDRIEIYRPLKLEPGEARLLRAKQQKKS